MFSSSRFDVSISFMLFSSNAVTVPAHGLGGSVMVGEWERLLRIRPCAPGHEARLIRCLDDDGRMLADRALAIDIHASVRTDPDLRAVGFHDDIAEIFPEGNLPYV